MRRRSAPAPRACSVPHRVIWEKLARGMLVHRWRTGRRDGCTITAVRAPLIAAIGGGRSAAVTPQQALASVQTGQPLLSCREPCLAAWQAAQPQAAQLAAGRHWGDLAALVLGVGYEDDLSLYYLGNAAEGIGYPAAAAS